MSAISAKIGSWSLNYRKEGKKKIPILFSGGSTEKLYVKNEFIYGYGQSHAFCLAFVIRRYSGKPVVGRLSFPLF
jgi:hypothetical protein